MCLGKNTFTTQLPIDLTSLTSSSTEIAFLIKSPDNCDDTVTKYNTGQYSINLIQVH